MLPASAPVSSGGSRSGLVNTGFSRLWPCCCNSSKPQSGAPGRAWRPVRCRWPCALTHRHFVRWLMVTGRSAHDMRRRRGGGGGAMTRGVSTSAAFSDGRSAVPLRVAVPCRAVPGRVVHNLPICGGRAGMTRAGPPYSAPHPSSRHPATANGHICSVLAR